MLAAALALIDERGLDELTMRALGAELGVEAMSIYKHVPSKGAVLDGVVEVMLTELSDGAVAGTHWRGDLAEFARRLRELSLAHPNAFPLLSRRSVGAYLAGRSMVEGAVSTMMAGGFTRTDAINSIRVVVRFTLGYALTTPHGTTASRESEPPGDAGAELRSEFPLVAGVLTAMAQDGGEAELFEFGLAAVLHGLERLAPPAPADPASPRDGNAAGGS